MRSVLLIIGCVVLAGCGVAQPGGVVVGPGRGSGGTFAANQRAARAFAQDQLSAVRLPSGAAGTRSDPAVGGVLAKPQSRPGIGHLIDRHRFWRVPEIPAALIGWLRRHPPGGTRLSTWGSGGNRGVASVWMRGYSYRTLPQGIYKAELDFAIAAAKGGGSAVRVDSFAAGLVPRPAWEHVPSSVAKVAISVRRYDGRRSYSVARVSDPALVRRLVRTFNGFEIAQPGAVVIGCPPITGATPQLGFRFLSATGDQLAEATESACAGLKFAVGGRSGPALSQPVDLTQLLWSEHALAVCSALSVKGRPVTHTPAPKEFTLPFTISDTAAGACALRGYPRVRLQMATSGKPVGELVPHVTRIPAGHPVTPPVVLLDPSWPATTSIRLARIHLQGAAVQPCAAVAAWCSHPVHRAVAAPDRSVRPTDHGRADRVELDPGTWAGEIAPLLNRSVPQRFPFTWFSHRHEHRREALA